MISQFLIGIFGVTAILLVGRKDKWQKWGYIVGLLGQPFWFYSAIINEQWGIVVLCIFYLYSWGQGAYNHWIKK